MCYVSVSVFVVSVSVFVVVGVATMTSMGESPMMMFIVCFTAIALFYIAHWQTFVSGEQQSSPRAVLEWI